jgi:hypothetical protein
VDPGEGWVIDHVGRDGKILRILLQTLYKPADSAVFNEDLIASNHTLVVSPWYSMETMM